MINKLVKILTSKDVILYDEHRQTLPLVTNVYNKQKFLFFELGSIWKYIPFRTTDKRKHIIMYIILNCINPKYIISMNWISQRESLYKVWTAKHPDSKFVVVQHGSYVGGIVTDIPHRYTKCDVFLVWGKYFETLFKDYNKGKNIELITFGNPVYNFHTRHNFTYKQRTNGKILLLPTALDNLSLSHFYKLINRLKDLNFELVIKTHAKQGEEKNKEGKLIYPKIEGIKKTTVELYEILCKNDFDFIISDHSTALLDAIFFKNKVIYFDSNNITKEYKTYYSNFLPNLFLQDYKEMSRNDFYNFPKLDKQEILFNSMISSGNNQL